MAIPLFSPRGLLQWGLLTAIAMWMIGAYTTSCDVNANLRRLYKRGDILTDLGPKLSSNAHIHLPGSSGFTEGTTRWSTLGQPDVDVVVQVATENDVAETVKYANSEKIPFITNSGAHGSITSLGGVKKGIGIWLNQLTSITISQDGTTAEIGGGSKSKAIIDTLWEAGKQTVTGGCECVSLLGPALGGGHGWLQGLYGLMADQFVSLRMVLADGNIITVGPSSDLWWAVKGAGHNFGIVTSVTSKIYDVPNGGVWSFASFIFTRDKVEDLYEAINQNLLKNGTQPVDVINYSFFYNDAAVDSDHSVIALFILQSDVESVKSVYTEPFKQLSPEMQNAGTGTYRDLASWTGNDNEAPQCQNAGLTNLRFPVSLEYYNPTAQRKAFDTFASVTHQHPALYNSMYMFEGYSLQGVQDIPADSTAFPHRQDNLLVSPVVSYEPAGPELDCLAKDFGEKLRDIVFEASGQQEKHVYVNYAYGDEGPKSWYGYESWRQNRLQELKRKYDSKERFNFYAPIE